MADGNAHSNEASAALGSEHGLWLHGGNVVSVTLDRNSRGFPPDLKHCLNLSQTIQGLARATKSVAYHANMEGDAEFLMQPLEDIADAIVLLSQLSEAIQHEATREAGSDS